MLIDYRWTTHWTIEILRFMPQVRFNIISYFLNRFMSPPFNWFIHRVKWRNVSRMLSWCCRRSNAFAGQRCRVHDIQLSSGVLSTCRRLGCDWLCSSGSFSSQWIIHHHIIIIIVIIVVVDIAYVFLLQGGYVFVVVCVSVCVCVSVSVYVFTVVCVSVCLPVCVPSERSYGGETVFVRCIMISVCASVRSGSVNQSSLKRLKQLTSNLTCMFPGTVQTWPFKFFSERVRGQGHVTP